MSRAAGCASYHHGDLRNALIVAGAELIEENGSADFAMIDAARRAGVSSAAPYRHFKDKDDLLFEVCMLAIWEFSSRIRTILERETPGTRDCICALGQGYVRFNLDHPQFFELIWSDLECLQAEDTLARRAEGFALFHGAVDAWHQQHGPQDADSLQLAFQLWSCAHGIAALGMQRQFEKIRPGDDLFELLNTTTHTLLDGVTYGPRDTAS